MLYELRMTSGWRILRFNIHAQWEIYTRLSMHRICCHLAARGDRIQCDVFAFNSIGRNVGAAHWWCGESIGCKRLHLAHNDFVCQFSGGINFRVYLFIIGIYSVLYIWTCRGVWLSTAQIYTFRGPHSVRPGLTLTLIQ